MSYQFRNSYGSMPRAPYANNQYNQRFSPAWQGGKAYGQRNNSGYAPKRKSNCTVKKDYTTKAGKFYDIVVSGWKITRRTGFMSFIAFPASSKFQKGNQHITMVATVKSMTGVSTVWSYWNPSKQILSIPDLNINAGKGWVSFLTPKSKK